MSDEENTQQLSEIATPSENPVSEPEQAPVSSQEPTELAPTQTESSIPSETPPEPTEATPNPESVTPVKDDISANEPFDETQGKPSELAPEPLEKPGITIEKHGTDTTITEVMQPEPEQKPETAQMAGNEPFDKIPDSAKATPGEQDKPIDLVEEINTKKREENLKLANETRQEKKRDKIDKILEMFSEQKEITNDEVEKLLHVSDATATRYLEQLEKEGKVKQVGKTGKGVKYEKI